MLDRFTSHYVSINSCKNQNIYKRLPYLHPTMYLLILVATSILHSINVFTSHYVSINSNSSVVCCAIFPHLHPTMYLLILKGVSCSPLSYLYLHPTMYLLILGYPENSAGVILFTSHYVSINSRNY